MMKHRIFFILFFLLSIYSNAQRSISLVYFDNTKTYLAGGSISVHFKPNGVYPFDATVTSRTTNFRLQLIRSIDSSVFANDIGFERNFFVPMLNGTIPAGTPNGNYKIRVIADSANVELSSVMTAQFGVQSGTIFPTTTLANPSPILSNTGDVSCFVSGNHFGYLNKASGSVSSNLTFDLPNHTSGYTYNVRLINHATLAVTPIIVDVSGFGGATTITLPSNLDLGHYTLEISKTASGLTSTNSFIYYNNTGNTALGNLSSENVCINSPISFSVDQSVIEKNYAGSYYIVSYGDNTKVDTFTQARFLANLSFLHSYSNPTCSFVPFPLNGRFVVTIQLYNKGLVNTTCNLFSQNGNGTTKSVNTSTPPTANFYGKNPICINDSAKFTNTTLLGFYGTSAVCNRNANFVWTIKRPSLSNFQTVNPPWVDANNNLNVPQNIFNEVGSWQIKLTAANPQGCTIISEIIKDFCVQPQMTAGFKFDDGGLKDSIVACSPKNVVIANSTATVACSPTTFSWQVMRESDRAIIASGTGTYTYSNGNSSSQNPTLSFTTPGRYLIKMTATNICKTDTLTRKVILVGNNGASLPPDIAYCGVRTIRFDTSLSHIPTYSSTSGNGESVTWSVTPATHSFVGGTTANSFYPQIQFNNNTSYNVTLTFNSNYPGGAITKTQIIRFDQPASINIAADKNPTVCRTNTTFPLNATVTGPASTLLWSTSGSGTYSANNNATSTYTFNNNDKNLSPLLLILSVTPNAPNVCIATRDTIRVNFTPSNTVTSALTKTICSGVAVNQTLTSLLTGSTFAWTSAVTSGVTGNSLNGTGTINDVLVNSSSTTDAVVTYTITPIKDGCNGTPSSFTVTIKPQPNISSTTFINPTSCGGNSGSITLKGLIPNISFSISYVKNGGTPIVLNGTSNASGDLTINNLTAGVYSTISVSSAPNNCASNSVGPITLSDPNGPAIPVATSNSAICSGATLTLGATSATNGVTFNWSGPVSFSSTGAATTRPNVTVAMSGTYSVTATLNSCTSAAGNVTVVINETPATPTVSSNSPICSGVDLNLTSNSSTPGVTYTWTGPNSFNNSTQNPTITTATTLASGTYNVTASNGTCTSTIGSTIVTVKPTPKY
ncbi:MAG: PKD-like domain-containing protein [Chitinophagaceae bacterium]